MRCLVNKSSLFIHFLVASLLLAACCPVNQDCNPRINRSEIGIGDQRIETMLWISRGWVEVNETVTIKYTINNQSNQPIVFSRTDGPVVDIIVTPPDYVERNWSSVSEANVINTLELAPYEQKEFEWTFVASLDGPYSVDGIIWFGRIADSVPNSFGAGAIGQ